MSELLLNGRTLDITTEEQLGHALNAVDGEESSRSAGILAMPEPPATQRCRALAAFQTSSRIHD